jgi:hypothetical protein
LPLKLIFKKRHLNTFLVSEKKAQKFSALIAVYYKAYVLIQRICGSLRSFVENTFSKIPTKNKSKGTKN